MSRKILFLLTEGRYFAKVGEEGCIYVSLSALGRRYLGAPSLAMHALAGGLYMRAANAALTRGNKPARTLIEIMKTTVEWPMGQFAVRISLEIAESAMETVLEAAAKQVLQRKPAGDAEFAAAKVAGLTAAWPRGEKSGKPLRPKGFERSSIPFTDETASEVDRAFRYADLPTGFKILSVIVNKHEIGEKENPTKQAEAAVDALIALGDIDASERDAKVAQLAEKLRQKRAAEKAAKGEKDTPDASEEVDGEAAEE